MLDIKLIRKERGKIEALLKRKEPEVDLSRICALDEKMRLLKAEDEKIKAKRNELSKQIGEMMREKKPVDSLKEEVRALGDKIAAMESEYSSNEEEYLALMNKLPNIPFEEIKESHNIADNVITKEWGKKPEFSFPFKNHLELNEKHKLFDFERSAKTSGSGWPAYKGMGARLEWALLNYMIDIQIANGFQFWLPPLLVRREILYGSGQIPKFNGQFYELNDKDFPLYLIPTSEVVLNGLHSDEILEEDILPLKYVSCTPCFRRESGAAGSKERGLIRMHQFNKVEMFCFTKPEESAAVMDTMMSIAEQILQGLGLHYRLALLVTGDMSFGAAKTVDIEAYLPGQNRYYEVSSVSNCTDFQSRRSQIRYRNKAGKVELVHTLNGSGLATSRLMVALLENNQREDGSIDLPPVLQEKLGVSRLVPKD
jgi:seryl-tRNA synthetase